MIFDFTQSSMPTVIKILKDRLRDDIEVSFEVLDPTLSSGLYAGESILLDERSYLHHSFKSWTDLAELLDCRITTPVKYNKHTVLIKYIKLRKDSFHKSSNIDITEKYGIDSIFSRINKLEEPIFIWSYQKALESVKINSRKSILNLGINRGDEFIAIKDTISDIEFKRTRFTGIDHSHSAIKNAQEILPYPNMVFLTHDINQLDSLNLEKHELIISIGTLQSPDINTKTLVMNLIQNYLSTDGAVILGFPNSRWIDGELVYGARPPNYPYPEMSLVIKDIYWIKKYLQQHKFRVTVTGREYLFLVGTKIR